MLTLPRRRMCSMQNYEFINSDAKRLCSDISVYFCSFNKIVYINNFLFCRSLFRVVISQILLTSHSCTIV